MTISRVRRGPWSAMVGAALLVAALAAFPVVAQDGPPGITTPTVFPPFDPNAAACSVPPGLTRVLGYVQENDRDFLQGVDHGLAMAAKERGLEYKRVLTGSDAALAATEIDKFRDAKVGALIATSSDPAVVALSEKRVIWSGAFLGTVVPPPATLILNAPQYATGKALTDVAIDYIRTKLNGRANVVLLTQDSMQFLAPRFTAMRDGLSALPGVNIIADIAPQPVTREGGRATMDIILLANPRIDVVLGADAVVLGALDSLRAAGKDRPDQFFGGIDGEPDAVAEIKKGDGPYKASIALSSPVFGFAMGEYGADWLEGKSVPQAMDTLPIALTSENIGQYEADLIDPASAFHDPVRRAQYLKMYGNVCYDTRDQYVNFPWSSEG
jgi:ribose transport system substrate-binding protein